MGSARLHQVAAAMMVDRKLVVQSLGIATAYTVAGCLGRAFAIAPGTWSAFCPAAGIALAAALLWGGRAAAGIWLAAFLISVGTLVRSAGAAPLAITLLQGAAIATGSTCQALAGAWALRRWIGARHPLEQPATVMQFVAVALAACLIGATWGATVLVLVGTFTWASWPLVGFTWWVGDLTGILIAAPVVLAFTLPAQRRWRAKWTVEVTVVGILLMAAEVWVFLLPPGGSPAFAYVIVPFVLWIAFRFGTLATAVAVFLLSIPAAWGTSHDLGFFWQVNPAAAELSAQAFLGMVAVIGLTVSAALRQRDMAERALRENEERLSMAFSAAQEGVWDWNLESGEVFYSSRWKGMLGYSEAEIKPHVSAWQRLLHPDDQEMVGEVVAGVVRGERTYEMEFRMRHKDGHYVHVLSRGYPVRREPGGPVTRIVGTHFDLTQRKQVEEQLRTLAGELEQRVAARTQSLQAGQREFAALHRVSEIAIQFHDIREALQEVVREVSAAVGFPVVAIEFYDEPRQLMEFVAATGIPLPPNDAALRVPVSATLSGVVARSGQPLVEPRALQRPEYAFETLRTLHVQTFVCVPLQVRSRVIGTLSVAHPQCVDVNEHRLPLTISLANLIATIIDRKQAEEALRQSEARYRLISENTADVIWTLDTASSRFTYVSPSVRRLRGYTAEEVMSQPLAAALFPEDYRRIVATLPARIAALEAGDESARNHTAEVDQPCQDGSIVPTEVVSTLLTDSHGRVTTVLGVSRDITLRRHAEQQLQKALADFARSNRELEQFANVISHDLQEPLRMVASYTQLLSKRYGHRLDQDAKDFIGFAVDGANRMQRLILDLLAYSRVGTRVRPLRPVDSQAALGEAIANLHPAIEESCAMITNDDLPTVLADHTQVLQVFQNLIGNAIKFRKPDDPPRIHVAARAAAAGGGGNEWQFSVRDNGIGIDRKYWERIFVIFQRLHGKEEYPGTGIGLAICQRIVERHGGRIWVESRPGEGSTFYFTLRGNAAEQGDVV